MPTQFSKKLKNLGLSENDLSVSLKKLIKEFNSGNKKISELEDICNSNEPEMDDDEKNEMNGKIDSLKERSSEMDEMISKKIDSWYKNKDKRAELVKKMQAKRKENIAKRKASKDQHEKKIETNESKTEPDNEPANPPEEIKEKKDDQVVKTDIVVPKNNVEEEKIVKTEQKSKNGWIWWILGGVAVAVGAGVFINRQNQ